MRRVTSDVETIVWYVKVEQKALSAAMIANFDERQKTRPQDA